MIRNIEKKLMILCLLLSFTFAGCSDRIIAVSKDVCRVVIEDGKDFTAAPRHLEVSRGEDAVFSIALNSGGIISYVDYPDYDIQTEGKSTILTLKNVRYSTVVKIGVSYEYIVYHANGGESITGEDEVRVPVNDSHLGVNTALGTELFYRDGYVLTGWNTKSDGSGEHIGCGSRTKRAPEIVLYAEWVKCTPADRFFYRIDDGVVSITGYQGTESTCVIPEKIEGFPVEKICAYAFVSTDFNILVLPQTVNEIEKYAFCDSELKEIYCFDSFSSIHDDSFYGCTDLKTLHINAARRPSYSGTYYDTFTDKFDRLMSLRDSKKLILFSGSSARFGYDSPRIDEAFPYDVVNMGVYAYTNALPQLELIRTQVCPDDILLIAPEFDAVEMQFCVSNSFDKHFFCMTESNYDLISLLDLRNYTDVFTNFCLFLSERSLLEEKDYSVSASDFDEDGNDVQFSTYNEYGDFIYPRPNGNEERMLRYIRADYTVGSFPQKVIESYNKALQPFADKGVVVYFSYAPRNISSLTAESTQEERRVLHEYLVRELEIPIISEIEDSLYSAVYFYEIDNHLSTQGVALRTDQIIIDLMKQLEADGLIKKEDIR